MHTILFDPPRWQYASVPDPVLPSDAWVKVRVLAAGICGSDIAKIVRNQFVSGYVSTRVLGHEICGSVVEAGGRVTDLAPGVRVVLEPLQPCRQCEICRTGATQFCAALEVLGRTRDGGFAELICAHRDQVHPIPDHLDSATATLVDPLATVLHAFRSTPIERVNRVAVIGDGAIGLLSCLTAAQHGATDVVLIGKHESTAAIARTLGAKRWFSARSPLDQLADSAELVVESVGGAQADSLAAAIRIARPGGAVAVLGVFPPSLPIAFPARSAFAKELRLYGFNSYQSPPGRTDFADALRLLSSRAEALKGLVTHTLSLSRFQDALRLLMDRRASGAIRVVLTPGEPNA